MNDLVLTMYGISILFHGVSDIALVYGKPLMVLRLRRDSVINKRRQPTNKD